METVIVICLLIVITLLLRDKVVILKRTEPKQQKLNPNLPDIMGLPRPLRSLSPPNTAIERQIEKTEMSPNNLDIEYDENENLGFQIPQEELEEGFKKMLDFEEEEEEWNRYGMAISDNGFAQGVTFEELNSVGMLLQKEKLEPVQKETAITIIQKIQGTELFSLLENSIAGTSRKIAELLDNSLSSGVESGSSILQKNDLESFDIGEFL